MAAALALLAAVLFAAALITTQFGLRHREGLAGAKVSISSATALCWLLFLLSPPHNFHGWNGAGAAVFIALGVFFPVSVTLLAYEANRRLGPTIAGAIGSTAPLFAVLGAVLFLGETLGLRQAGATLAIVAGSVVLVWRRGQADSHAENHPEQQGSWVAWLAAALRALAQVIAKAGLLLWPNPYAATLLCYSTSAVVIWLIGARSTRPESRIYNRRGVMWFALTGLFNSCAIYALYTALESGALNIVSPIAFSYPLFTLLLNSVILREERLSPRLVLGVALTVGGVAALLLN